MSEVLQDALFEHSAILLTRIKRKSVLKPIFGLLFEWPLQTGFTVYIHAQRFCLSSPIS